MNDWRVEQAKIIERWREAMNILSYGFDEGVWKVKEGSEEVFYTDDRAEYERYLFENYGVTE